MTNTGEDNMTDAADKTKLWDAVCTTDPAMTRKVQQRGGFTAICAQYQKHNATIQWGPMGEAWGLRNLQWGAIMGEGATPIEVTLDAELWFPGGSFPISVDMAYKVGNDTRKKLRTDAMTKALSDLGFNSDVFLGKFDDSKYVADLRKKIAAEANGGSQPQNRPSGQNLPAAEQSTQQDKPSGYTDLHGWKGADVLRRPLLAEASCKALFERGALGTLKEKLAHLEEVKTDFQPHDYKSLRGEVLEWIAILASQTS